jgi:hypothetical protein
MCPVFVIRVDNATPIILNCEKSVTLGILGTLALWRFTKLSPGTGEQCVGVASTTMYSVMHVIEGGWTVGNRVGEQVVQ